MRLIPRRCGQLWRVYIQKLSRLDIVSKKIREEAEAIRLNLLPEKSKRLYTKAYNTFKAWRKEQGSNSFCEDVLLSYFSHVATEFSPTSVIIKISFIKWLLKEKSKRL